MGEAELGSALEWFESEDLEEFESWMLHPSQTCCEPFYSNFGDGESTTRHVSHR